jgi:hypothetical protein
VEGTPIVETGCAEGKKIFGGFRDGFAEDFELDLTVGGVELVRGLATLARGCVLGWPW